MFYYKVQFLVFHSDKESIGGEDWWTYKSNTEFNCGQIVIAALKGNIAAAIVLEKSNTSELKPETIKFVLGFYDLPVISEIGNWCLSAYSRTGISASDWFYLRLCNFPELWLNLDKKLVKSDTTLDELSSSIITSYSSKTSVQINVDEHYIPVKLDKYLKSYNLSNEQVITEFNESLLSIPMLSSHSYSYSNIRPDHPLDFKIDSSLDQKASFDSTRTLQYTITNIINNWPEVFPFQESHITYIGISSINQVLFDIVRNSQDCSKIAVIVPEKWWQVYLKSNLPQEINMYLTYEHNSIKNILSNLSAFHTAKKVVFCGSRELLFITCLLPFDKIIVLDGDSEAHFRQQKPKFHSLELVLQQPNPIDVYMTSPSVYYPEGKYRTMNQVNIKNIDVDKLLDSEVLTFSNLDPLDLKKHLASATSTRPVMIFHNRKGYGHLFRCHNCSKIIRDFSTGKIVRSTFVDDQTILTTDFKSQESPAFMNTLFGCPHEELELIRCGIDGLAFDFMKSGFEVQIIDAERKLEVNSTAQIYICTNIVNNMVPNIRFSKILTIINSESELLNAKKNLNRLAWKFGENETSLEIWLPVRSKLGDVSQLPIASEFLSALSESSIDENQEEELEIKEQDEDNYEEDYIDIELQKLLSLPPFGCQIELAVRVKLHAGTKITKKIDELVKNYSPITFRIFKGIVQTHYRVHIYRALLKPNFDLKLLHPLLMSIRSTGAQPVIRWDRLGL